MVTEVNALPAFKNAAAVRLAARCSQNERTMLGALEVVAVSARLSNGERRKERLLLLGALLDFHGELFGFGAMEEAKCFVDSLGATTLFNVVTTNTN